MGRPYRGYIGFATDQTQYELANSLGGIVSLFDRNQTLASDLVITGGTVIPSASTPDGYDYHVFTGSGTLSIVGAGADCDLMLIAGGGGGGGRLGGGGGAGGYLYLPNVTLSSGDHVVTVGAGGAADPVTYPNVGQGVDQKGTVTKIDTYTAYGGGGGSADNGGAATSGGSGGGGAGNAGGTYKPGLNPSTPAPVISADFASETHPYAYTQGYPGATATQPGGGGGAGAAGSNRDGGIGKVGDIPMPASYGTTGPSPGRWFAGGGGGCGWPNATPSGAGGSGGGGTGGAPPATNGVDGTANTGGGGGSGGQASGISGAGGSGLLVVRVLV